MRTGSITVHLQQPIASIQPHLHGQFIEHLGTCIYDGIWVGERSSIPNINGIRRGVVEALQQLHPPVIRWPGGCFADGDRTLLTPSYHVFDMYQGHRGGVSLRVDFAAEQISFGATDHDQHLPMLHGSASIKDGTLTLSVVNLHSDDRVDAEITIDGAAADEISLAWLSHNDILAHNTFEQPNTLVPQRDTLPALPAGPWRHTFPPASVSVFTVRLAGYQDDRSRAG